MKILDLQTGDVHEYGSNCHDSLAISRDGRTLTYYNLQNGDGSMLGDYRFVMDDNKVPEESQTADAIHAECYFDIGGWHERNKGAWLYHKVFKERIATLEAMTAEPEPGEDARLDADELDAVLFAIKILREVAK